MNNNSPIIITPPSKIEFPDIKEVWNYRDLLFFLTQRDIKVRFQQTFIGFLWIVLQPLIQMLIFTVILGILVRVPTDDIPYPVFFLSGFIVWQFFSQVVNSSAFSLVVNIGIIIKTYFPRLVLPLSAILSSLVDLIVSFLVLLPFLLLNKFEITSRYFLLPVLILISIFFSSGVGLLFGALMVVFRDTKNLLNFILMIWMYSTPIMYPISIVPDKYQFILFINPLTSIVESYRWVFLNYGSIPSIINLTLSLIVAIIIWLVGLIAFRSMENKIADVM